MVSPCGRALCGGFLWRVGAVGTRNAKTGDQTKSIVKIVCLRFSSAAIRLGRLGCDRSDRAIDIERRVIRFGTFMPGRGIDQVGAFRRVHVRVIGRQN